MTAWFDHRVLFVVGKGGVGKSVVAGALGLAAANTGKKTVIAEMNGGETMSALFDVEPVGYEGKALAHQLRGISITPSEAIEEYLVRTLRIRLLYDVVFRNRTIESFMNGVLGLSDLISVGKVMDLERERLDGSHNELSNAEARHDLVIVDCPATGHGLSLLRAPGAMMDLARVGPLFRNAQLIADLLGDRTRTAVLLVTLAEEMPINETIDLANRLSEEATIHIAGLIVNGMPPKLFETPQEEASWETVRAEGLAAGGHAKAAVRDAERALADRSRAESHVQRLKEALPLPLTELPLLTRRDLDVEALQVLGTHLRGRT